MGAAETPGSVRAPVGGAASRALEEEEGLLERESARFRSREEEEREREAETWRERSCGERG